MGLKIQPLPNLTQMKYKTGVIVGRFQVDRLTPGHRLLIDIALNKCEHLIIFVGTTVVRGSKRNPLDYVTRKLMLLNEYPEANIHVSHIPDQHDDTVWSMKLDERIELLADPGTVCLFGGRDSFIPHYNGRYPTEIIETLPDTNATDRRTEIGKEPGIHEAFRRGVIYHTQQLYPSVYATVDIAVFHTPTNSILLGRKPNETKWRLFGGFSDPTDVSFEAAAIRELKEEASLDVTDLQYILSQRINDWRYAKEENKIITTLFAGFFKGDMDLAKAGDDIAEVKWFNIKDFNMTLAAPAHTNLIENAINYYYDSSL